MYKYSPLAVTKSRGVTVQIVTASEVVFGKKYSISSISGVRQSEKPLSTSVSQYREQVPQDIVLGDVVESMVGQGGVVQFETELVELLGAGSHCGPPGC